MSHPVSILLKRGSLYFDHQVYTRFLAGLETIILLRRGDDLCILPVRTAAAGGYLLKRRNSAGDRVVTAPDFFRDFADDGQYLLQVDWSEAMHALVSQAAFRLHT